MTESNISDSVRSIVATIANAYENIQWVCCPICKEEWTKLQPVAFYRKGEAADLTRVLFYSCPPCAKSVLSTRWLDLTYGIATDTKAEIHRHNAFYGVPKDDMPATGYYLKFPNGTVVATRGDRVGVYEPNQETRSFENIAQALIFVSEGPIKKIESPEWGE